MGWGEHVQALAERVTALEIAFAGLEASLAAPVVLAEVKPKPVASRAIQPKKKRR